MRWYQQRVQTPYLANSEKKRLPMSAAREIKKTNKTPLSLINLLNLTRPFLFFLIFKIKYANKKSTIKIPVISVSDESTKLTVETTMWKTRKL